ncbi:winged helix-turn-helix domain-containing protein [Isoptericola nanjingensis]|uniref:winged helix-turn-helix domain-containing protein n=1 Tax=Isoptericola TaxID=254250 RepID=UPI0035ED8B00|nr:winged helix-turn-helix transcriptional regulator [Isoptericola sp. QY 916]
MPPKNVVEPVGGYVLCIGLPLQRVGEVARLLRGRAAVIATADTDGARTLLGPPPPAVLPDDEGPHTLEVHARAPAPLSGEVPVVAVAPDRDPARRIVLGALEVDLAAREVIAGGVPVHLSIREFDLLVVLASAPDRVWSFAELTSTVWRTGYLGDPDPVVSAVKRLRKRLRVLPELRVSSVRGIGYRLVVPS